MKNFFWFLLIASCCGVPRAAAQPLDGAVALERATRRLAALPTRAASSLSSAPQWRTVARDSASCLFADTASRVFVLAAADGRLPALLGYGECDAAAGAPPPALRELMGQYARRLRLLPPVARVPAAAEAVVPVAPLLTTVRRQTAPFNRECPRYATADDPEGGERCVVGCVATALEQILTYYRRVYVLRDTLHGWTTDHYVVPDVLPGRSVDTRSILDDYAADCPADEAADVARLSYWLGVAAHMEWGPGESGAASRRCIEPLQRAFGMGYVYHADSYRHTPQDWLDMLHAELRAGRPVYYAANTMRLSGHAFVLDGLDAEGLFHVNWGYDGSYDGYFDLRVLYSAEPAYDRTPEGVEQGFACNHEAVFLHPDTLHVTHPDTLRRTGQEIEVKSFRLEEAPMLTAYTPATLVLRNTAAYALTTPFEFFTNLPADTAFFDQGDYVALIGTTLAPGEERAYPVHLRFDAGGRRILRLSPDDVHFVTLDTLDIAPYAAAELQFSAPEMEQDGEGGVRFALDIRNLSASVRAGRIVTYELSPADDPRFGTRGHAHYFYLPPGGERRDTVRFLGLEAGRSYELLVRCPWAVVQRLAFTYGATPDGIHPPAVSRPVGWYGIDGRPVSRPVSPGIYIRDGRKVLR